LKLEYDGLLLISGFKFNLRRHTEAPAADALAAQLCTAVGVLVQSDLAYGAWRATATVVPVGNADLEAGPAGLEGVDTRTYAQLLAGVPAGRCTCATVLDALIGQVAASCCDPADVARAADIAAVEAARAAIATALGGLRLEALPEVDAATEAGEAADPADSAAGAGAGAGAGAAGAAAAAAAGAGAAGAGAGAAEGARPSPGGGGGAVTLLQEGDMMSTLKASAGGGGLGALMSALTSSVVRLDPDTVEANMVALTPGPGTDRTHMPAAPEMSDDACGARKTALTAYLPSADTPLPVLERHELLAAAAALLPPGVQEDHSGEVRARRHWEPITRQAYAAVYSAAALHLGGMARRYHAPEVGRCRLTL
jgi:hypothetical protein